MNDTVNQEQPAAEVVSEALAPQTVDSTSDQRVVNNVMRHNYRVLSESEKESMRMLKDSGLSFINQLHGIGATDMAGDRFASRELALAATRIEEAVMWAVKHITK